jgi:hypothetical protein
VNDVNECVFSSGLIPVYNYTVDWTGYYTFGIGVAISVPISVYCLVISVCCVV